MKVVRSIDEIKYLLKKESKSGKSIGYVPTMGYLHEGHESLLKKARSENDVVVCSIFVNPTQFGEGEDYDSYPRDLDRDSKICERNGVDYIFHPSVEEMYPEDFSTFVIPGENMTDKMCAISRPTHFRGVCTVLNKFFNIISPNNAYFGQKDVQQVAIVKRMVSDLNLNINIVPCPIVREGDGLAKSSRNTYLNEAERNDAICLNESLKLAKTLIESGEKDTSIIKNKMAKLIESYSHAKIDYIEIVDFNTFKRIDRVKPDMIIAVAVYIGNTRLIDNMIL